MEIIQQTPLISIRTIVITLKNNPALELRRRTTNYETIKTWISSMMHDKPVLIQPTCQDKLKTLNTLTKKGILIYNTKKNRYEFLI